MRAQVQAKQLWRKPGGVSLRSDDGVVEFRLSSCDAGLFVERVEQRAPRMRVIQSAIFSDATAFARWCDADAVRFDYPVVYVNLKRHGDRALR